MTCKRDPDLRFRFHWGSLCQNIAKTDQGEGQAGMTKNGVASATGSRRAVWRSLGWPVMVALLVLLLVAQSATAQQGPPGQRGRPGGSDRDREIEVGVVTAARQDVPYVETLPGRAVAYQTAEIRPRVGGVIKEIPYQPGRPVKAGDVLFVIEDDTFRAALQSADASVAQAAATLEAAKAALERARTLRGVGTTQAALETAQVALAQAEAGVSAANAARQVAQIDMDQTRVRSPIDGIADISALSIGAIVTANQTEALTTVLRVDPIYVDVQQSSAAIIRNRALTRDGSLTRGAELDVSLTLEDGSIYQAKGRSVSPSATVSTTTGTAQFRFQFDNPDRMIMPGQFLRVEVTLGTSSGLLVPQRATSRSADGSLTAYVARDGKAEQVVLTETGTWQNQWIVSEGLNDGDAIIVDNLQNVRAGRAVKTVPVTISAQGLVSDANDTTAAPPAAVDGAAAQTPPVSSAATSPAVRIGG